MKIQKSSYPDKHSSNDFKCFGPPATVDGQFDNCKIADLGSFSQDEKDSNKYYHACVCQSTLNNNFYTYYEWGRVGASNPQFQFEEFSSEIAASKAFVAQCHEKNDKRGIWGEIAGKKTLLPKAGKDVYLVRQLATRSTGLPDAKTIKLTESVVPKKITSNSTSSKIDPKTSSLLDDLMGGTISYTKGVMADDSIPSQQAINDARDIIFEAQKLLIKIGPDVNDQINNNNLRSYSGELYRRIPKRKSVGTPDSEWILSQDNILSWNTDLDAFESALNSTTQIVEDNSDPFRGLPLFMEWLDTKSNLYNFVANYAKNATANKHYNIGDLKIKNIWNINRNNDHSRFIETQKDISKSKNNFSHRALFQPKDRIDLTTEEQKFSVNSNSSLLFHGSRSCNILGIMREFFRFPKELSGVVITGANFGPGTYFADDWKKSAGYTSMRNSYWSNGGGAIAKRDAFMFVCDVILGEPHLAPGTYGFTKTPNGTHSIFGKGRNALKYTGGTIHSGVENNEWVLFAKNQIEIKYLIEFAA